VIIRLWGNNLTEIASRRQEVSYQKDMYFIKRWFKRKIYKLLGITPDKMSMTKYYKTKETQEACITTNKDGAQVMRIKGEDYDFPGFPRSHLLFGTWKDRPFGQLAVLKHEIKNQIFNDNWARIERGEPIKIREPLQNAYEILDTMRYDIVPREKLFISVREIYDAFTRVQEKHPEIKILQFRDMLCFILQEDDSYRFRVQFLAPIFSIVRSPVKNLMVALQELEYAEVVDDMKERIRLLRRVLWVVLMNKKIKQLFEEFFKEVNWKKVKLSKADKYHFRPKWFKADWDLFEY